MEPAPMEYLSRVPPPPLDDLVHDLCQELMAERGGKVTTRTEMA